MFSTLYPGSQFKGKQQSKRSNYSVSVTIQVSLLNIPSFFYYIVVFICFIIRMLICKTLLFVVIYQFRD